VDHDELAVEALVLIAEMFAMNELFVIPILSAFAAIAIGGAFLVARWSRRAPLQERLRNLEQRNATTVSSGGGRDLGLNYLAGSIGSAISKGGSSLSLQQRLNQAGYHHANAAARYLGAKVLLFGAGTLITLSLPIGKELQTKVLIAAIVGGLLFFIPNALVSARRERRRSVIRRHLPDAIDLLEICASAGMGLDMAWNSVTEEVRSVSTTLADEMALTNLEIHLGAPRAVAMRHMAHRTGAEELSSLVAVLVQSERFGTSIREALRTYATSLRETRSQHAQESAEKMAVKLIFPMVVFIFPAVVMVMAGPGFMMLYQAMRTQ
jgi:tight adherence protein C